MGLRIKSKLDRSLMFVATEAYMNPSSTNTSQLKYSRVFLQLVTSHTSIPVDGRIPIAHFKQTAEVCKGSVALFITTDLPHWAIHISSSQKLDSFMTWTIGKFFFSLLRLQSRQY